jgi:hypothetical protein
MKYAVARYIFENEKDYKIEVFQHYDSDLGYLIE